MAQVEIGIGKTARRAVDLSQLSIVPSRRTRAREDVDISWQLDGYRFDLPVIAAAMDGVSSPATCAEMDRLGGLGVLNLEGLWTRYDDPAEVLADCRHLEPAEAVTRLREIYAPPVQPDLIRQRVADLKDAGVRVAGALRPQRVEALHQHALDAGLDILVIEGTVVSAEHQSLAEEPLNLKQFIARYDLPVMVGGCGSYSMALHLMRTGAAGVLVGVGAGGTAATRATFGLGVPMATALADVAGARSRHLEETGRNVQIIANGGLRSGGDIAKAIACGADAVMMGAALARSTEAPGGGALWGAATAHESLPRGSYGHVEPLGSLEEILIGPTAATDGSGNLCGGLRGAMAAAGYAGLREFQRAEVVLTV